MSGDDLLAKLLSSYPVLTACCDELVAARDALIKAFEQGGKLLLCGNGGSAADCEHIAGELLKGFEQNRPLTLAMKELLATQGEEGRLLAEKLQRGLPAISLVGHMSLTTAFANDVDPQLAFAQLAMILSEPGDALLAISTSGEAKNVILAARAARALGLVTIGLTGRNGGKLGTLCDVCIHVPADDTAAAQELHVPVYHYLCRALEAHFFAD